ncbi:MAG: methyltransferase domain-containing protein [Polyangiaceae bacterium]
MAWFMSLIYDRFMSNVEEACLVEWRADLLRDLAGEVLEIGAGTGANLPHYPRAVTRLVLTEPDRHMRLKLHERVWHERARAPSPSRALDITPAPSDALPFPDSTFDAVVSTLVLCSVPDPARSLAEMRRVLRPAGKLIYLEHVAAEDRPDRLAWQRRIEPAWKHLAGNCHLTRRTADTIRAAGFTIDREQRESMHKAMFFTRPTIRGVAHK